MLAHRICPVGLWLGIHFLRRPPHTRAPSTVNMVLDCARPSQKATSPRGGPRIRSEAHGPKGARAWRVRRGTWVVKAHAYASGSFVCLMSTLE